MTYLLDPTVLTVVLLLVFATVIALVRSRRRDRCLRSFDDFHISMAEKGGDLVWGEVSIYTTGLSIQYAEPIRSARGHWEASYIFYKDQFPSLDALYRYPDALPADQQTQRERLIKRTTHPGLGRRLLRGLRNWLGMIRDAALQAVTLLIGAARTRQPGSVVLTSQEQNLQTLSGEIIGYVGNAYDPLLEQHLFEPVVLEITRHGSTVNYCGWLKDYTKDFLEVLDAVPETAPRLPLAAYHVGATPLAGLKLDVRNEAMVVRNGSGQPIFVQEAALGDWERPIRAIVPAGFTADLALPPNADPANLRVWLSSIDRVDIIVPRSHAIVRHASVMPSDGANLLAATPTSPAAVPAPTHTAP